MYDSLSKKLIQKKQKKDKVLMFSYINNQISSFLDNENIDILRFDLSEFSFLNNYKDINRISSSDILPIVRNTSDIIKNQNSNKLLAVDLPVSEILYNNSFSLDKIIKFYNETKADFLVINFNYIINDLINKLSKIKIPTIIYCSSIYTENDDKLFNNLLEVESMGSLMLLIDGFSASFTQKLKSALLIPVICSDFDLKSDGYYAQFISVFGLNDSSKKTFLNFNDLLKDGISDCVSDLKK